MIEKGTFSYNIHVQETLKTFQASDDQVSCEAWELFLAPELYRILNFFRSQISESEFDLVAIVGTRKIQLRPEVGGWRFGPISGANLR